MENHDLIDRYFENSLSPKEQKLFNDLLQTDSDFIKEFKFRKDLKEVIAANQREELKNYVSDIESRTKNSYRFMLVPKKWMVAASILLITSLAIWTIKDRYYPSNEALYAEYFQPDRNTVHPIVRGETINTIEHRAFIAYEAQNYHKAVNLFNSVKHPDEPYILYYESLCYLAVGKYQNAVDLLKPLAETNSMEGSSDKIREKANWYLALGYLGQNDKEKSIEVLSFIVNENGRVFKKSEAEEILEYLH